MAITHFRTSSITSPDPRSALHRRALRVLLLSQVLSGLGMAAGISVGALLAQDMLDSTGSSGLPTALFTAGSALAALLVGRLSQRHGRRPGLAAGYAVGALGGAGIVLAAVIDSVPLLFASFVFYGSGLATTLQARYAGGDLAAPQHRARAMSTVLFATTLGAVAGPNLTDPMGSVAGSLGIPALAGPFLLASLAYAAAGVVVALLLRPDPLLTAQRWADEDASVVPADNASSLAEHPMDAKEPSTVAGRKPRGNASTVAGRGPTGTTSTAADREPTGRTSTVAGRRRAGTTSTVAGREPTPTGQPLLAEATERRDVGATARRTARQDAAARRTLILAGAAMVVTQTVMVAIMTMTPIHMHDHGHGLGASGLVISIHIAAMFLPSPLSGQLVDRFGPRVVLVGAGLVLLAAGVVSAAAPPESTITLAVGLALLGFGWSLGLAAGTAMVTDAAPLDRRARTQGAVDVSIAIAGATGGLASGYMVASTSYPTLATVGGVLGLLLLPLVTRIGGSGGGAARVGAPGSGRPGR